MRRRDFLKTTIVAAGPLSAACSSSEADAPESFTVSSERFPQSVASGDPRPHSVVLWTRVAAPGAEARVELQLATDEDFTELISLGDGTRLSLVAHERWNHCVRVRVDELDADTVYYYRFLLAGDEQTFSSRTGRTRTAPLPDADRVVRFAVMSCQDFGGRYYHALALAAEQDLDFFVHLGDYIYETVGDPAFQSDDEERQVSFSEPDTALRLERELEPEAASSRVVLAARSLSNYRDLYQTVRSDRNLQRLHERFAMICVPDDHEYSDDCHGQSATYQAGQGEEKDPERRANADQAWFEFMPVDYRDEEVFEFDRNGAFPDNLELYRDFVFGRHLHLVMTELRRNKSDHVIAEDAFPAAIALTEPRLLELVDELPAFARPYVIPSELDDGATLERLLDAVKDGFELGFDAALLEQPLDLEFVNALLLRLTDAGHTGIDVVAEDGLARGIPFVAVGKREPSGSFGARYFVDPDAFELLARARFEDSDGASEQLMGERQEAWFIERVRSSKATWKVWGNPYTLTTRQVDLSSLVFSDPSLARRYRLSADDWDGYPNRRKVVLEAIDDIDNVVVVTGDSHSFFASGLGLDVGTGVLEFVCGAVSSSTYQAVLESGVGPAAAVKPLAPIAGPLIAQNNPHIAFQDVAHNGFAVLQADADALHVEFLLLPFAEVTRPELAGELADAFRRENFRVQSGSSRIEQRIEGSFAAWDPTTRTFGS